MKTNIFLALISLLLPAMGMENHNLTRPIARRVTATQPNLRLPGHSIPRNPSSNDYNVLHQTGNNGSHCDMVQDLERKVAFAQLYSIENMWYQHS